MGYCEVQDIKDDFKDIVFSDEDGAVISEALVEEWIEQESAFIDGKVGLKYVTPVTAGAQALLILKRICIFRVAERVKNKIEVKHNATQNDESEEKYLKNRVRTPNDDLNDIYKGFLLLAGADLLSQTGSVNSFNVDVCDTPFFDTSKQQW